MAMTHEERPLAARLSRQKRTVLMLSSLLIIGGLVILFALKRVAVPIRMMAGLGDIAAGCILLVAWRQKFAGK